MNYHQPADSAASNQGRSARQASSDLEFGRFFGLSVDLRAVASTKDGTWKRVNPAFERILGWTEADTEDGKFMEKAYPDPDYREEVVHFMLSASWSAPGPTPVSARAGTPVSS